jgi:hypothetical protein
LLKKEKKDGSGVRQMSNFWETITVQQYIKPLKNKIKNISGT